MDGRNWYDLNSGRRYPLDDAASGEGVGGELPPGFLADARILFPESLGARARVGAARADANILTLTVVSDTGEPLAALGIGARSAAYGKIYPLTPLSDGVAGWVVFGHETEPFAVTFTGPGQSEFSARAARTYRDPPVKGVGRLGGARLLGGVVTLQGGGDVEVVVDERDVAGLGVRDCVVVRLKPAGGGRNPLAAYRGACTGRPESGTCNPPAVETVAGVAPDANGDLTLVFEPAAELSVFLPTNTDSVGLVKGETAFGALCPDKLPADDGSLPLSQQLDCPSAPAADPAALPYSTAFGVGEETGLAPFQGGLTPGGAGSPAGGLIVTYAPGTAAVGAAVWAAPDFETLDPLPADPDKRRVSANFKFDDADPASAAGGVLLGWRLTSSGCQYYRASLSAANQLTLDFWTGSQFVTLGTASTGSAPLLTGDCQVTLTAEQHGTYKLTASASVDGGGALASVAYTSPAIRPMIGDGYGVVGSDRVRFTAFAVTSVP